jgi:hypothetical protein
MMSFFQSYFTSTRTRLRAAVLARLVWLIDYRLTFAGDSAERYALLAVIGREHYRERRKRYPIVSRVELGRVIALELAGRTDTFWRMGPPVNNVREVQFFELSPEAGESRIRALFWFPESLVASFALSSGDVAKISRNDFSYFLSDRGGNQLSGGAIVSPALFRMASGLPLAGDDREFVDADVLVLLRSGVSRLTPSDWWRFKSPEWKRLAAELWQPISALTVVSVLVYLCIVSAYLFSAQILREHELAKLGPEVSPLLEAQRQIDVLVTERASMQRVFESKVAAWPMWEVAATAWRSGAAITTLSFKDGEVTINGSAASAIDLLQALAKSEGVSEAKFESGVRQSANEQLFVIRVKLKSGLNDGR